jgi:hypothetical protein
MGDVVPVETPSFEWNVLRSRDLLVLGFRFFNLAPSGGEVGASLIRVAAGQPAYVVVDLAPQHVFEQAEAEADPGPTPVPVPLGHRMAQPSRIAFLVPDDVAQIPFTLDALLDWSAWLPSLVPVMSGSSGGEPPAIREPEITETSLELPYRLILEPDPQSTWAHAVTPRDVAGRAELWHSRLTSRAAAGSTVRAVWSPDWPQPGFGGASYPVQPMAADDRRQLVGLTSDFTGLSDRRTGAPLQPVAVPVDQLLVSALGGWLSVHGVFYDPPPVGPDRKVPYDLVDWKHIATEGRDHYTKLVYAGTLYPFGLRAHLVRITERKVSDPAGGPVAALLQRQFIIVRELFHDYSADAYPSAGREMPLRTLTVKTLVTPNLIDPSVQIPGLTGNNSLQVVLPDGTPVPFHLVGTDVAGNDVDLTVGMFWIDDNDMPSLGDQGTRDGVAAAYATEAFARGDLGGQRMTFAPQPTAPAPGTATTGDTSLHTTALRHAVTWTAAGNFLPVLRNADVHIPAIEQLAGPSAAPPTIQLAQAYLSSGLDDPANNASSLFAEIAGGTLPTSLPQKFTGGLINPDLAVSGLSAHLGPVAGTLSKLAAGVFDPADFFGAVSDTKLFGAVGLGDLIAALFDLSQMPQTVTRFDPPTGVPSQVTTTLSYAPQVRDRPDLGFQADDGCALTIKTVVTAKLDGSPPQATTDATLTNFTFVLPPGADAVIEVHFESVAFHAEAGTKPDFSVQLITDGDPIEFEGILSFLNELKDLIPANGFSDPPALQVTEAGIDIGYSLGLPPLAIGVFQLSDVSLGADLTLPFTGDKPRLRFNFCEREHPCLLTVSMLGGGAFLALGVGLDGIELIEAAIDFGGSLAFDIGIASGGVSVLAGIYFRYDESNKRTELDGFLRMDGSLEVLGLVTVSVEFDLTFGYVSKPGGYLIRGEATISVKVDLTLFSFSVSLHAEKSFGSAPGDPDFQALMPTQADWDSYVNAFAA